VKLFTRRIGAGALFTLHPKAVRIWRRVNLLHGDKDGAPVLKGESSWRTVVGFAIVFRSSTLLVQFRRHVRWSR